jgi:hypothetical protein
MWDQAIPKLLAYLESTSNSFFTVNKIDGQFSFADNSQQTQKWNSTVWEDLILRLLSETIKIANDDEWTLQLGEHLAQQFPLYNQDPELKRVAMKQLGLVLQKSTHKEFLRTKLEVLLQSCNPSNADERQGCAQAFGYCAASHLDMALEKLQHALNPNSAAALAAAGGSPAKDSAKKSGGFLGGLFSSSSSSDSNNASGANDNTAVILAFGYVAAYAPPT